MRLRVVVVVLVLLLAGLLSGLLTGCGEPPVVTPELVAAAQRQWPTATAAQLLHGREVLMTKCTVCHGVRQPADHPPAVWQGYIEVMSPRAQLDDQQRADLLRYVLAGNELAGHQQK